MRGRALRLAQAVTLLEPRNGEIVRAEVEDEEDDAQTVTLVEDGAGVRAECGCDAFIEDGRYCEHIWAVLLTLEESESVSDDLKQRVTSLRARPPKARKRNGNGRGHSLSEPEWVGRLSLMRPSSMDAEQAAALSAPPRRVLYVLQPDASSRYGGLFIELRQSSPTPTGWSRPKPLKLGPHAIPSLPDPEDRWLCALLIGSTGLADPDAAEFNRLDRSHALYRLPAGARHEVLQRLAGSGRCYIDEDTDGRSSPDTPLTWLDGEPWRLVLSGTIEGEGDEQHLVVQPRLRRGDTDISVNDADVVLGGPDGVVVHDNQVSPFDDQDAFRWVSQFRDASRNSNPNPLRIPVADLDRFFDRLYLLPQLPELALPEGLGPEELRIEPTPRLEMFSPGSAQVNEALPPSSRSQVLTRLWFDYGDQRVSPAQAGRFVPITPPQESDEAQTPAVEEGSTQTVAPTRARRIIRRHRRIEEQATARLHGLGLKPTQAGPDTMTLPPKRVGEIIGLLMAEGWAVAADQKIVRNPGTPSLSITSGIDWFELRGGVRYRHADGTETTVSLPDILAAARAGRPMIELADGTQGLLPEAWLEQHGLLTALGQVEADHLRYAGTQAALLDGLLQDQGLSEVEFDARFAEARERLTAFDGIEPMTPTANFDGSLRPYQQEGLGWTRFLRWFGMGGVLADDMGLGKTVQVLAMIQSLVDQPEQNGQSVRRPSLIVAPRSVVFNWLDEAQRFTAQLRVAAYMGAERASVRDRLAEHDVIVTTYGLMRRDVEALREVDFEYVVLDEAQAIKNPSSQSAKAARLLLAQHRLALTGTPIENHLGDLWSIFEFLNPGMLGSQLRFAELLRSTQAGQAKQDVNDPALKQIARSLRPFILRRTKREVLKDLPEKTEQTILCEMEPAQRRVYDDLKAYYRGNLMQQLDADGAPNGKLGRSAFMVLEALLRLRQAACHPGLIDEARRTEPSAKCDVLYDRLADIIEEGSKALVFSQFTSMLSIVREGLEQRGIRYCYLDGQTRDRKSVVEAFQNDGEVPVFLISLKAGGFGLNLTAAEYVFILDPWWNPAVEAQAIDRTHRIGQTKPVFAYRLVCEDTVEQRILDLQARKRELADAIVGGDQTPIRQLTRQDLERLLS